MQFQVTKISEITTKGNFIITFRVPETTRTVTNAFGTKQVTQYGKPYCYATQEPAVVVGELVDINLNDFDSSIKEVEDTVVTWLYDKKD